MSGRSGFLALALLATALGAVIALELAPDRSAEDASAIVPIRHLPIAKARGPSEDPVDRTDAWVATSLARPLFSRDRRPTAVASKGGPEAPSALPRLAGVMVTPLGSSAIFAAPEGGKTLIATEGTAFGPYTVESIAPGLVTVAGPDGVVSLRPAYDAAARKAGINEAVQQQLQQQQAQQQQALLQQQQQQQQATGATAGQPVIPGQPLPQPVAGQPGFPFQPGGQNQPGFPSAIPGRPGSQFQRALDNAQVSKVPPPSEIDR